MDRSERRRSRVLAMSDSRVLKSEGSSSGGGVLVVEVDWVASRAALAPFLESGAEFVKARVCGRCGGWDFGVNGVGRRHKAGW